MRSGITFKRIAFISEPFLVILTNSGYICVWKDVRVEEEWAREYVFVRVEMQQQAPIRKMGRSDAVRHSQQQWASWHSDSEPASPLLPFAPSRECTLMSRRSFSKKRRALPMPSTALVMASAPMPSRYTRRFSRTYDNGMRAASKWVGKGDQISRQLLHVALDRTAK